MLKRLIFRNFQKHRKTVIDLRRVTVIVGQTEAGKSAAIRGLRWLFLNDAPDAWPKYARWGTKRCSVEADVDGRSVIRRREVNGVNSYILDGKELKAIGTTVPEEVANLLNVGDNNFQDQDAPLFWLSETPGTVSRKLNQIINLEEIDDIQSRASSKVRNAKADVRVNRDRLNQSSLAKRHLKWVTAADAALQQIESLERQVAKHDESITTLTEIIDDLSSIDSQLKYSVDLQNHVSELKSIYDQWNEAAAEHSELDDILDSLSKIERLEPIDASEMMELVEAYDRLDTSYRSLCAIIAQDEESETELCRLQNLISETESKLHALPIRLCPTCHQPMEQ